MQKRVGWIGGLVLGLAAGFMAAQGFAPRQVIAQDASAQTSSGWATTLKQDEFVVFRDGDKLLRWSVQGLVAIEPKWSQGQADNLGMIGIRRWEYQRGADSVLYSFVETRKDPGKRKNR